MAEIIPFPDRSAILIDRLPDGALLLSQRLCPRAAGRSRVVLSRADALDYAEALAREAGTAPFVMCDL